MSLLSNATYAASVTLNNGGLLQPTAAVNTAPIVQGDGDSATITNNTIGTGINITTGGISTTNSALSFTNMAGNVVVTGGISSTSGDLDFISQVGAGTTTANINLGSNTSSSVLLQGGNLVGNVTMANNSQTLTFAGGNLTGNISGSGTGLVNINSTNPTTLNGDINASLVTVQSGSTLSNSNDRAITANVTIQNNATFDFGGGTVNGAINSANTGGTLLFSEAVTTGGAIAYGSTLSLIDVKENVVFSTNDIRLVTDSASTSIAAGKSLSLESRHLLSNVNIASGAKLILAGSDSSLRTNFINTIGVVASGDGSIEVAVGATGNLEGVVGSPDNVSTTTSDERLAALNLLSNSTSTILSNSTLNATKTNLSSGSNLNLSSGVVVNSDIQASEAKAAGAGIGTVKILGNGVDFNGDVGSSTRYVAKLDIDSASDLVLDATNDVYADSIELEAGSLLTLSSSTIKATNGINGEAANQGALLLSANRTLSNGDFQIGSGGAISSLAIGSSSAVTASSGYDIRANAVSISGTGASLTLAAGTALAPTKVTGEVIISSGNSLNVNSNTLVTGTITGVSNGAGNLNVAGTYTTGAAIGGSSRALATVSLASSSTLNAAHALTATNINLGSNAVLNVNGGTLSGIVNGSAGGNEVINFNSNVSLGSVIGANIDDINIANGSNVTANANISAANIDIGTGTSGTLVVGASVTTSSTINIANNATLTLSNGSSVTGAINGATTNGSLTSEGTVIVFPSSSVTQGGSIGATRKVATVEILQDSLLVVGNNTLKANEIILRANSTLSISNGALEGTIRSANGRDGDGGVNILANTAIGTTTLLGTANNSLAQVTVANSLTSVALNQDVYADNFSIGTGSTATLAASKSITGNVNLSNTASTLVLSNGSSVVGNINGITADQGALNIASNAAVSLAGNVGATSALRSVVVSDGATLTTGANQLRVHATNGLATLGTGSTLVIGTGAVSGNAIDGSGAARGRVLFAENNSIAVGTKLGSTDNTRLSAVDVAYGKTVTISEDVRANTLTVGTAYNESTSTNATALTLNTDADFTGNAVIGANSKLTLAGTSSVSGTINGSDDDKGTLEVNSNGNTIALGASVGATKSLATVSVLGTTTLNAGANTIKATNVSLAAGSTLSTSAAITGAINGAIDGAGRLTIANSVTLDAGTAIGQGRKLNDLLISSGTLTTAANVKANTVTVGSNSNVAFNVGAGTTVEAAVTIANNSTLTVNNNSVIAGTINGEANNEGILAISNNSTFSAGAAIGSGRSLGQIAVGQNATFSTGSYGVRATSITAASGSTFNLGNENIVAGGISLAGATMNFGDFNNTVVGAVSSSGGSTLNLGNSSHDIDGNLTIAATDIIKVTANSTSYGALNVIGGGVANVAQGASLSLTIDPQLAYVNAGSSYEIVAGGTGSNINAITDSKVDVNALGSNRIGLLTFTSSVSNNKLIMTINRDAATEVSVNSSVQESYNTINEVGALAAGELKTVQDFVVKSLTTTSAERQSVLESVAQNDVGANQAVFSGVTGSINVIENRISNLSLSAPSYKVTDSRGNKVSGLDKSASALTKSYGSDSSEEVAVGRSVWGQAFGTNARQSNSGGFNGYDAKTRGLAFGMDQKIEADLLVGAAVNINNTDITSANGAKKVSVDSYQLTLYGEKKYNEYFVDGFVAGALNRFGSDRRITLVGKTASANYDGYSYSAKARVGMINRLENGFDVIPHVGLVYAYNSATDYEESGAGTLDLSVNNSSAEMLIGDIGVALAYDVDLFKYKLRPELKVSYGHDFIGNEQVSAANFVGQSALLNVANSKSDRNMIRLGVGTDIYSVDQFTLNASYLLEKRETYQAHTGLVKAKYSF